MSTRRTNESGKARENRMRNELFQRHEKRELRVNGVLYAYTHDGRFESVIPDSLKERLLLPKQMK